MTCNNFSYFYVFSFLYSFKMFYSEDSTLPNITNLSTCTFMYQNLTVVLLNKLMNLPTPKRSLILKVKGIFFTK